MEPPKKSAAGFDPGGVNFLPSVAVVAAQESRNIDPLAEPWAPDGVAFCWQPKAARRKIRNALDAEHAVSSGLLVYDSLTEIASDKRSRRFQTTQGFIAMMCGLSPRTVQQRIKDLVSIRLILCDVPNLKAPATYTLLAVESSHDKQPLPSVMQPIPNDAKQLPHDKQPLPSVRQRSKNAPLPTSKECIEERPKRANGQRPIVFYNGRLTPAQMEIANRFEIALGIQWDAGNGRKWIKRCRTDIAKSTRVLSAVEEAAKRNEITTTPAQAAEHFWTTFK
jgi:hypothetical protein